jgi:hypothetical protein
MGLTLFLFVLVFVQLLFNLREHIQISQCRLFGTGIGFINCISRLLTGLCFFFLHLLVRFTLDIIQVTQVRNEDTLIISVEFDDLNGQCLLYVGQLPSSFLMCLIGAKASNPYGN